jgi:hypothetical protein
VAAGFARAAATQGATLLPMTDVLTVNISAGKVTGVTTAKSIIEGPVATGSRGKWDSRAVGTDPAAIDRHGGFG